MRVIEKVIYMFKEERLEKILEIIEKKQKGISKRFK